MLRPKTATAVRSSPRWLPPAPRRGMSCSSSREAAIEAERSSKNKTERWSTARVRIGWAAARTEPSRGNQRVMTAQRCWRRGTVRPPRRAMSQTRPRAGSNATSHQGLAKVMTSPHCSCRLARKEGSLVTDPPFDRHQQEGEGDDPGRPFSNAGRASSAAVAAPEVAITLDARPTRRRQRCESQSVPASIPRRTSTPISIHPGQIGVAELGRTFDQSADLDRRAS